MGRGGRQEKGGEEGREAAGSSGTKEKGSGRGRERGGGGRRGGMWGREEEGDGGREGKEGGGRRLESGDVDRLAGGAGFPGDSRNLRGYRPSIRAVADRLHGLMACCCICAFLAARTDVLRAAKHRLPLASTLSVTGAESIVWTQALRVRVWLQARPAT